MAKVGFVQVKPEVALTLSWEEFESIVACLAVAVPADEVTYLARVSPRTTIVNNGAAARVNDPLFSTLENFLKVKK